MDRGMGTGMARVKVCYLELPGTRRTYTYTPFPLISLHLHFSFTTTISGDGLLSLVVQDDYARVHLRLTESVSCGCGVGGPR
jgi:hypothetical protein